jgi:hypothetical protein
MKEESRLSSVTPTPMGSYPSSDVIFLLKDLGDLQLELTTEQREQAIQSGGHYSEMLPIEKLPSEAYMELYKDSLQSSAQRVALAAAKAAELIVAAKKLDVVLVSLARAGTPVGILIKRFISFKYKVELPHYSISIIRGKGIDENALLYIQKQHPSSKLQFVDGWTGKGAIRKVLIQACEQFNDKFGHHLDDTLAVLADPGHCTDLYGTREDFLIPSACLNSTVSGLVSRTVLRDDLVGPEDFHGAKYYKEWAEYDVSNSFIQAIVSNFPEVVDLAELQAQEMQASPPEVSWKGWADVQRIQEHYEIESLNMIKPGVGETTRVLLRRLPWKILVDRLDNPHIRHILHLANEKQVSVEVFPGLTYSCCGIIKSVKGDME